MLTEAGRAIETLVSINYLTRLETQECFIHNMHGESLLSLRKNRVFVRNQLVMLVMKIL